MPDQEQLTPEDSAALVHAQQQLYSAGDPRAAKLYNYIVQAGYATKGDNGELHPTGETKSFYDQYLKGTLSGNAGWQQAVDKASQTEPIDTSSAGGFAKSVANDLGAGAVRVFSPAVHPLNAAAGLGETASAAMGNPLAAADLGEKAARPFVENPSGEAVAAIPQAAMALAGGGEAETANNAIEHSGTGGGVANTAAEAAKSTASKFLPSLVDGPPESLMTRAVKPGKNNVGWSADIQKAIPLMKSAEQAAGTPITGVDDAINAAVSAKKSIWSQYQAHFNPAAQMGATIDGNQIADAMMDTIGPRARQQNPALVERITQQADSYRRPMTLDEAEEFLSGKQGVNADLNSYYAKNKVGRRQAEADPEMAATVAEGDALRSALYAKIDQISGPGAAQLKQAYGALSNVENELRGRKLVAERQNPESLTEQMSTVRGVGKIAKGAFQTVTGNILEGPANVAEGTQNIAVSRAIKARNTSDAMIERAFQAAKPAQPFPMPSSPRLAGLLPRGPLQTPAPAENFRVPDYQPPAFNNTTRAERLGLLLPQKSGAPSILPYNPQMTPGEHAAATMQDLRKTPQLALPAQAGNGAPLTLPYTRGMTIGEQRAAMLHYLRQRQQLGLPAQAQPIQLPPSF